MERNLEVAYFKGSLKYGYLGFLRILKIICLFKIFVETFLNLQKNMKNMLYRLSERYPLPRCMLPYNLSQKILVQQTFSYIYTNSFMIKICTFLGFFIINYGMFSLSKKELQNIPNFKTEKS